MINKDKIEKEPSVIIKDIEILINKYKSSVENKKAAEKLQYTVNVIDVREYK